jgi:antitoxin component YwqK of YwqJK toxin-antitoxin module
MKFVFFLCAFLSLMNVSCSQKEVEKQDRSEKVEDLVDIKDGVFTEYYPGKEKVKFRGRQDENQKRHGRWVFYSQNGEELSISHYNHGEKHGHTVVKYPTGGIHYMGEYENNKQIGIWKTYDESGKLLEEKNFDLIKD